MKKKFKSLSSKIVNSIAVVTLLSILTIFSTFEGINKKAFYTVEAEKAELVLGTIEPLIALNIYLSLDDKIEHLTKQLLTNPNILAIKVSQNGKIIHEIKSESFSKEFDEAIVVQSPIFEPNSKVEIGKLELTYSSKNFTELINKYTVLLVLVLFVFAIVFFLFGLYVKRLLSPLRKIAKLLKNYSPDTNITIPFDQQDNEIGFISKALNKMQFSILRYSQQQQDINNYLEEKVNEKTEELLKRLYTNTLTGLPNRRSLLRDIHDFNDGALLIVNIDDFKEINDFFGQASGDHVLISFSRKLSDIVSQEKDITLIHLSGDEFALLFTAKPSKENFKIFALKLIDTLEKIVFTLEDNDLSLRVSIGGVYQIQEALEKADIALKSAKKQQKSFMLYDESLKIEQQYKNNMEWTKKLNWAIENDKILPYFQPVYENKTNKIVSAECLIRFIDVDKSIITPLYFLTIAKKSKLYSKLTKIMIKKSCEYFEHLECDFSVNLSVEDILNQEIVAYILYNVKKYNVAHKIVFELLETEGIENFEEVSLFINEMKFIGCRVAIDDFGSGYSNFEYLLQLNVDYIKIDGSLIKNLDTDTNAQIIVETIVSFAKKLNMVVVAEFVHNKVILEKVKALGIERSQGFYLAEPQADFRLNEDGGHEQT